ncbi:hypothetical protein BHYA_0179g00060 [Botrytis hyacinthi]|uniref:Uncharacterized protein n=1 Tax=Botrytis hyacinthi TaxID=278943 RepID=A0A4Z1GI62_9HELO|nr:hypothetical protein BHYA_0179g00060 [Botrytis hyacinthi]
MSFALQKSKKSLRKDLTNLPESALHGVLFPQLVTTFYPSFIPAAPNAESNHSARQSKIDDLNINHTAMTIMNQSGSVGKIAEGIDLAILRGSMSLAE